MAEAEGNPLSSKLEGPLERLAEWGAEALSEATDGIPAVRLGRAALLPALECLKTEPELAYEMLTSVTAVDWLDVQPRFEVVYHLWSLRYNRLLRLKCGVPEEDASISSVVHLYRGAEWQEREVFDMFGIEFRGHPDLKRILMPEGYPYHPLRKDFPVEGIDNSVSYRALGGVLMTNELDVDRPAGQDRTPVDLSSGDPEGYSDGAELADD
jgi:NADH-quinone oxidoreductase subunit C